MNQAAAAVLLFLALVPPSVTWSAERTVTLREAISLALERNLVIRSAGHRRTAAEHAAASRRSRYYPSIAIEESGSVSNAPTRTFMMKLDQGRFTEQDFIIDNLNNPSSHGDFRTGVSLELPLFDARIAGGVELADKELDQHDLQLAGRREDVVFAAYRAALEIRLAKALAASAEDAVRNASEHYRVAVARSAAGTGLKSDELRARTFLSEMEQLRLSARNNVRLAKLGLARLMGEKPGVLVDVHDIAEFAVATESAEELLQSALDRRVDLKEGEAAVALADAGVDLAFKTYLPTLYANAAFQMNDRDYPFGRDNDSWAAGLTLRWEIFDGFRRYRELSKAKALRNAAACSLEDLRREAALQVEEALLRREEARQRLEVARHAVRDAEEAVRLLSLRFENSLATMADLLDAQSSLNRGRTQVVNAENGAILASAQVLRAAGIFLQEVMR
ncbi:TolC family protein [Geobacter sp. DSM 9736]|uniref:TolC family protein n=1 Tax=Geobacter sp. DSM 9736 TaxID=1277350 RepID=UPI000B50782C|nr:TolC family protein [Geobacter sp. DSM 9736]SNB47081.1 Outer membrane protein TolC [Geobacter sp. DSM 9736]